MRRSKEGEVNRCWIRDVIARSGIREVREAVAVGAILHIAVLFCLCLNVVLYTLGASSLYEMNALLNRVAAMGEKMPNNEAREWNWAESVLSLSETPLQQIHVQPFSSSFILSSIFRYIIHSPLDRTAHPAPWRLTHQHCPPRNNTPDACPTTPWTLVVLAYSLHHISAHSQLYTSTPLLERISSFPTR